MVETLIRLLLEQYGLDLHWLPRRPDLSVQKFRIIAVFFVRTSKIYQIVYEPRQANLCLRAFRHDKF